MEKQKKVRLSDIADKLNISTVTVSKALSKKDGVSEDLRKQIKDLADELGYKTKKANQKNADGDTTGNIGILIPSHFFSGDFSFYWYLFNHLSKELLSRNYYSIMELLSDANEENLNLPRVIQDHKIDGLIVLGQTSDAYLEAIKTHYENFILLDFYTDKLHLDSVSDDDYYCSYQITNFVISQGMKNLCFVGNFGATTSITDRFMGFQKAMYENGFDVNPSQIIKDRDEKGRKIEIDLPYNNLPDAFICNCDETAASVINQLQAKGFNVPEDVSVTGFDNYLPHGRTSVELTTAYIRPEDTAKVAADLIIKKIRKGNYLKGRHLVSGSLVIRNSVKIK